MGPIKRLFVCDILQLVNVSSGRVLCRRRGTQKHAVWCHTEQQSNNSTASFLHLQVSHSCCSLVVEQVTLEICPGQADLMMMIALFHLKAVLHN